MKIKTQNKLNVTNIFLGLAFLTTALATHAQSWTNRFIGSADLIATATAIAVDGGGNAIVTGGAGTIAGGTDTVTIKYSALGVPLWTNRYSSPENLTGPQGIAVDAAGNVFVPASGGDGAIIKYSSAGLPLWTNKTVFRKELISVFAVDGAGNVCAAGAIDANSSCLTAKYSNDGLPLWTNRYSPPPPRFFGPSRMAVDKDDNVIVSGYWHNPLQTEISYVTLKYSAAGVPLWTNLHSLNGDGFMSGLAVDGAGSIFVTGVTDDIGNFASADILTIAYSSAGVPLWTNRFQGEAGFQDIAQAAAVDSQGNLFVAGYSRTASSDDYVIIKYSGAGVLLWTNYYAVLTGGDDVLTDLAVDRNGNAFITGFSQNANETVSATVGYSGHGSQLLAPRLAETSCRRIAVDRAGNVFVTGESWNGTNLGYLTVKYAVGVSPPLLNIQRLGNNIVLSWTNAAFGLQSASTVTNTFTNVPGATSPYTNALSGGQRFFRLAQ